MSNQGVELGPVLATDLHNILETPIGDQNHPGAFPFQKPIGGHRGAMEKSVGSRFSQELTTSGQNRLSRVGRCGGYLQSCEDSVRQEEKVREGSPGVHREDGG